MGPGVADLPWGGVAQIDHVPPRPLIAQKDHVPPRPFRTRWPTTCASPRPTPAASPPSADTASRPASPTASASKSPAAGPCHDPVKTLSRPCHDPVTSAVAWPCHVVPSRVHVAQHRHIPVSRAPVTWPVRPSSFVGFARTGLLARSEQNTLNSFYVFCSLRSRRASLARAGLHAPRRRSCRPPPPPSCTCNQRPMLAYPPTVGPPRPARRVDTELGP